MQQESDIKPKNGRTLRSWVGGIGILGVLVIAFVAGLGIGNGTITFGQNQVFSTPVAGNGGLPQDLNYTGVEQVYDSMRQRYDGKLDQRKLLEGVKQGLVAASGDRYTEYLSPAQAEEFNEDLNGTFSGIGAELSKEGSSIVIISPIEGFPAQRAGVRPRDVITEINGESAYNLGVTEAVNKIRGRAGTTVRLKIVRGERELSFTIRRETITIPSVESEVKDGIGYLQVTRFSEDTARLAREAAQRFRRARVRGVILDLRNNPGGLLESSVSLSSLWLPSGRTVLEERRDGEVVRTFRSSGASPLAGVSTVVLINEGSASASEITAGALKDNGAATLLGEKSFGKGSVQQLEDFADGSVLKVTIARWYTPRGRNIDREGIQPDQRVELVERDIRAGRDTQREAAVRRLTR